MSAAGISRKSRSSRLNRINRINRKKWENPAARQPSQCPHIFPSFKKKGVF